MSECCGICGEAYVGIVLKDGECRACRAETEAAALRRKSAELQTALETAHDSMERAEAKLRKVVFALDRFWQDNVRAALAILREGR